MTNNPSHSSRLPRYTASGTNKHLSTGRQEAVKIGLAGNPLRLWERKHVKIFLKRDSKLILLPIHFNFLTQIGEKGPLQSLFWDIWSMFHRFFFNFKLFNLILLRVSFFCECVKATVVNFSRQTTPPHTTAAFSSSIKLFVFCAFFSTWKWNEKKSIALHMYESLCC